MAIHPTVEPHRPTAIAQVIARQESKRSPAERHDRAEQQAQAERRRDDVLSLSYRRGRAIVAWCDQNPLQVSAEAAVHIERLRAAMANREYIASLIAWACVWVPETTWLGCHCPHFEHESNDPIDAEGVSTTASRQPMIRPASAPDADALDAEHLAAIAAPALSEN